MQKKRSGIWHIATNKASMVQQHTNKASRRNDSDEALSSEWRRDEEAEDHHVEVEVNVGKAAWHG